MSVRTVLLVDDDPLIRKLVATTLEDVAGFELRQADVAAAWPPALVFLDVNMPGLDGIGACRALRALPCAESATIVMLTAAGHDAEHDAREAGADLFLTKPFSPLDLLRLVDEIGAAG